MKAWVIERHGGPDVFQCQEVEPPKPKSNEVLIRVSYAGFNHLDLWVRKGVPGHSFPLPIIPCGDIAGQVEEVGQSIDESRFKKGQKVVVDPMISCGECLSCKDGFPPTCPKFGLLGETQNGGCAEYVSVPAENVIPLPDEAKLKDAASLPIAFITAWSMVHRKAKVQANEHVLVQAGGSGVSVALIQFAKSLGATVVSTSGSDEKAQKLLDLGCDEVINYQSDAWAKRAKEITKKAGKRGYDVIFDHVGEKTISNSLRLLNWGGRLVSCGATTGGRLEVDMKAIFFKNLSILGSTMGARGDLDSVLKSVASEKIRPVIGKVFDFEDAPRALEAIENHSLFGKAVIKIQ